MAVLDARRQRRKTKWYDNPFVLVSIFINDVTLIVKVSYWLIATRARINPNVQQYDVSSYNFRVGD